MIIEIGYERLNEILDFSWETYCQKENSSYHRYESKEKLKEAFERTIEHLEDKLLACFENQKLVGVLKLMVERNNKYLQSSGIYVQDNHKMIYSLFINYLTEHYSGYEIYFGYPNENKMAIHIMEELKADCVDSCMNMQVTKREFVFYPTTYNINEITIDSFEQYASFHDKFNSDIYWNSSRMKENFKDWKIYVIKQADKIIAGIFIGMWNKFDAEIFGISIEDSDREKGYILSLLSYSVFDVLKCGKNCVTYFIDENSIEDYEAASLLGFKLIDHYKCYKMKL